MRNLLDFDGSGESLKSCLGTSELKGDLIVALVKGANCREISSTVDSQEDMLTRRA